MPKVAEGSTKESESPSSSQLSPSSGFATFVVLLGVVALVTLLVLLSYRSVPDGALDRSSRPTPSCPVPSQPDPAVLRQVYEIGVSRGVSDTVMLAAFEAGWVESHMHNLSCGDRDSLGVFQQRPSQGWGTAQEVRDVAHAAGQFFAVAEQEERRSPDLPPGELAQAVQRSAYPERYGRAEPKARELLARARRLAGSA